MKRWVLAAALFLPALGSATPSNRKWHKLPVAYKVHAHSSINGVADFAAALQVVQGGFGRWTSVACTMWESIYAGSFTSPSGRAALNMNDGANLVTWIGGTSWRHDANTLGVTHVAYLPTGEIIDADMELNNNNIKWKVGGNSHATDVESVIIHEAGHFLGLDHTDSLASVMYPEYAELKTTLESTDINDVCTVYPAPTGSSSGATTGSGGTSGDIDIDIDPENPWGCDSGGGLGLASLLLAASVALRGRKLG
jgi:hypothetical protein